MSQNKSEKKVMRSRSRSRSPSRSPNRTAAKGKPAKTENQLNKQKKKDGFNKEVDNLKRDYKNLRKLNDRYVKVKPSHQLVFEKNGETKVLTRQELTNAESEYIKKLLHLKKLYVEGAKHSRIQIVPESFKAAYAPIKVGPVFTAFLSIDGDKKLPNFGEKPNDDGSDFLKGSKLLEALPRAKEGLFLKNSLTLLMYIYATVNNLKSKAQSEGQKNIPDPRMNYVFGKMEALYYQAPDSDKVLMKKSGHKMNTYEVVSGKNSKFNPSKIENYYFQSMQALNIYEVADLTKKDADSLLDASIRNELLAEYKIIEKANTLLKPKGKIAKTI